MNGQIKDQISQVKPPRKHYYYINQLLAKPLHAKTRETPKQRHAHKATQLLKKVMQWCFINQTKCHNPHVQSS